MPGSVLINVKDKIPYLQGAYMLMGERVNKHIDKTVYRF